MNTQLINHFWKQYKDYFKLPISQHQEKYKWTVLKQVYEKWDWSRSDKALMFRESFTIIGSNNLWSSGNFYPIGHTIWMFEQFPDQTILAFNSLFNETVAIETRIEDFIHFYDVKLPTLQKLLPDSRIQNHYHKDRRAIALYLSLQFPEKYFLYKFGMVQSFAQKLGLPRFIKGRKENLNRFYDLANGILNFIKTDAVFLNQYKAFCSLPENYSDESLHLLVQDFIYSVANHFTVLDTSKFSNVWLYSPGEQAYLWEDFYKEKVIALGWDFLGDLEDYETKDDLNKAFQERNEDEANYVNNTLANFQFSAEMEINDLIIVVKGKNTFLGFGTVQSAYYFDENANHFKSRRKVNWIKKGNWTNSIFEPPIKTLTKLTTKETINQILELLQISNSNIVKSKELVQMPLNQILYGPPGTGKTHRLKTDYFPKYTTKETAITPDQHFEEVVRELTWWQVIAIAVLDLGRCKVGDLLKHKWVLQKAKLSNSNTIRPTIWGQLQSHTVESCEFVNVKAKQQPFIFNKSEDSYWEILEEEVKEFAPELYDILDAVNNFHPNPDKEIKRYVFTTFHQSFGYEDFIEGIKPVMNENNEVDQVSYRIENGIFKDLCNRAENDPDNQYALFIDEINRGNVSAIFGELITLIETDKRKDGDHPMSATLPYSKKSFTVPSNVDIIGTMNTADRSVEALDTALRRRFSFVEMLPMPSLLKNRDVNGIDLTTLLTVMNQRIEALVDRDHTIGHAYFMKVETLEDLKTTFYKYIIPLLQEYFYGNYAKMAMVLGEAFFHEQSANKVTFAYRGEDYYDDTKKVFKLKNENEMTDFEKALKLLINPN